ncbi:MAG: peptidoglycan DD-metalloendopeptidase family protein [Candidatus Spechtbacterales bacterium]|nr:peptidoglycan DD-metalloendopeptidase family protein [Candidatus Spechtbacterales bacterium]
MKRKAKIVTAGLFVLLIPALLYPVQAQALELDYPTIPTPQGPFDLDVVVNSGEISLGGIVFFIYALSIWIGGILAFLLLVYLGFTYIITGAAPGARKRAKRWLNNVLWGLLILLFAVTILDTINENILEVEMAEFFGLEATETNYQDKSFTLQRITSGTAANAGTFRCEYNIATEDCDLVNNCASGYEPAVDCGSLESFNCEEEERGGNQTCVPVDSGGGNGGGGENGGKIFCYEQCFEECRAEGGGGVECDQKCFGFPECPDLACPVADPHAYSNSFCVSRDGRTDPYHKATDIYGSIGTKVYASESGVLECVGDSGGSAGKRLYLHGENSGIKYAYFHLDGFAPGIQIEGAGGCSSSNYPNTKTQNVVAGQHIAYLGDTGSARGTCPHVHYEMWTPDGSKDCCGIQSSSSCRSTINPYDYLNDAGCTETGFTC